MQDGHSGLKNEKRKEISNGDFQTVLSYLTLNERDASFVIHAYSSSYDYSPSLQRSDIQPNGTENFLERLGFKKCQNCNILSGEKCYYTVLAEVDRSVAMGAPFSVEHIYAAYEKFANNLSILFTKMREVDSLLYSCGFKLPYSNLKFTFTNGIPDEKIYTPGTEYLLYTDLLEIITKSKNELLIVDAYPHANLIDLYLRNVNQGVKIKLLIGIERPNNKQERNSFLTVLRMFSKLPNIAVEVRESKNIHDRIFIVDNNCWVLGSSIKDAAVKKTTYLIKLESIDLVRIAMQEAWNEAAIISV